VSHKTTICGRVLHVKYKIAKNAIFMKFMAQCSRKKVGLTIGMAKNAVNSKDYSKFIGLGLKLQ
jgi:hypothetical protein